MSFCFAPASPPYRRELKESAYIDGASNWTVFSRIVLPLSKPILATIGLFAGVRAWNDFFSPLLYLHDKEFWPLTIVLRNVVMLATFPQGEVGDASMYASAGFWIQAQMAVIVINILPVSSFTPSCSATSPEALCLAR